jgi:hypothetical protein
MEYNIVLIRQTLLVMLSNLPFHSPGPVQKMFITGFQVESIFELPPPQKKKKVLSIE